MIDFQRTPFEIATSASDRSNSVGAKLSHGWLSAHLELSLLLVNWHATTRRSSLVSGVSVNSHDPYDQAYYFI